MTMPTSTFDRKIETTDEKSIRKLLLLLADVTPGKTISRKPYSESERKRSEKLLEQCIARSREK